MRIIVLCFLCAYQLLGLMLYYALAYQTVSFQWLGKFADICAPPIKLYALSRELFYCLWNRSAESRTLRYTNWAPGVVMALLLAAAGLHLWHSLIALPPLTMAAGIVVTDPKVYKPLLRKIRAAQAVLIVNAVAIQPIQQKLRALKT